MPLPLTDETNGEDMDSHDYLQLAYDAVKAAVGHLDRHAAISGKPLTGPDIESIRLPLLAVKGQLASRVYDPDFFYGREHVDAMAYLELTHRTLIIAEHYFNQYTVHGGLNRLIPFVGDTWSAISCAKDDIAYQLGHDDAPYPIELDPLQLAQGNLENALRQFNTFALQQGLPSTHPAVAIANSMIVYAIDQVQSFIDKHGGDDDETEA